jgi:hypothetical protein
MRKWERREVKKENQVEIRLVVKSKSKEIIINNNS